MAWLDFYGGCSLQAVSSVSITFSPVFEILYMLGKEIAGSIPSGVLYDCMLALRALLTPAVHLKIGSKVLFRCCLLSVSFQPVRVPSLGLQGNCSLKLRVAQSLFSNFSDLGHPLIHVPRIP